MLMTGLSIDDIPIPHDKYIDRPKCTEQKKTLLSV